MIIIKLMRYLFGFVRFRVYADYPERLLNLLGRKEIPFWNVARNGSFIEADMRVRDYLIIRKTLKNTGIRTSVIKKSGAPFFIRKYKHRFGIPCGIAVFLVGLKVMTLFIWNINIVGNERISSDDLKNALYELGVKEGSLIGNINTRRLTAQLKLKSEEIAWSAVNIEGSVLTLQIDETLDTEKTPTEPSNLIASSDGLVTVIHVTNGTLKVKVGQTVRKGDLLASGVSEYKYGKHHFVRSSGEVIARTTEKLTVRVPKEQSYKYRTGKVITKRVLYTPFFEFPLYLFNPDYQYDTVIREKCVYANDAYIPIKIKCVDCYELLEKKVTVSDEVAERQAYQRLDELEKEKLPSAVIISRKVYKTVDDSGVILTVNYICEKNIAKEEKILFDTVISSGYVLQ